MLVRANVIGVSCDEFSHVPRRVLVEFLVVAEDEDSYINRTEDRELVRLLEQTSFPLQKGDRSISVILDGFDLNLSPSHLGFGYESDRYTVRKDDGRDAVIIDVGSLASPQIRIATREGFFRLVAPERGLEFPFCLVKCDDTKVTRVFGVLVRYY